SSRSSRSSSPSCSASASWSRGSARRATSNRKRAMNTRIRYALVGAGSRAQMYLDAIAGPHADVAELVAWADTNQGRLDWYESRLAAAGVAAPSRFEPAELAAAIARHRVQRVIVTSPDFTHAGFVVAALDGGADVVVEKPLTTSEEGVRAIAEAVERT